MQSRAVGTSALRLRSFRRLRRGAVAPLGHELVELGLVLGEAQPVEEVAEFALLVLEPTQRLGAVLVEGMVAARRRPLPRTAPALHAVAHAAHLLFHPLHFALPALAATTTHALAPDHEGEDREAHRPPEDEPEDHNHDPGRMHETRPVPAVLRIVVSTFSGGHARLAREC